jgi:hypothetical protein
VPLIQKTLRIVAPLLLLATLAFWFAKGAHAGWSMNRVPVNAIDEITEIEYTTYEERFVPGIDTLLAGVGLATLLFGLTFLPPLKTKPTPPPSHA